MTISWLGIPFNELGCWLCCGKYSVSHSDVSGWYANQETYLFSLCCSDFVFCFLGHHTCDIELPYWWRFPLFLVEVRSNFRSSDVKTVNIISTIFQVAMMETQHCVAQPALPSSSRISRTVCIIKIVKRKKTNLTMATFSASSYRTEALVCLFLALDAVLLMQ